MFDWLSNIDPDWVIALVAGLFTWWKSRKDGLTNQSIQDHIVNVLRQEYYGLYSDPEWKAKASKRFNELAWKALEKLKVPRSGTTELIVAAAVEKGMAELNREMETRVELEKKFESMLEAVAAVSFKPQENPVVPRLNIAFQEMCPEDGCTKLKGHEAEHGEAASQE